MGDCASFTDAWHYDDPAAPTRVVACPDTRTQIQGATDAKIDILLGCATKPAIPR